MKKTILLIAVVICIQVCKAQRIIINDVVNIKVAKDARLVNKEDAIDFANKKFHNEKNALDNVKDLTKNNTYIIDDVLISLFHGTTKRDGSYLLELKKGLDAMNERDKSYSSFIKTVNANNVLVTNDTWRGVGYYRFFCYNGSYTHNLRGVLEYDSAEKDKATSILNDILANVKFKVE